MVPSWRRRLFPLWHWTKVDANQVKACLQECFEEWGLPGCIRFDNGKPWANPGQRHVPSSLALWLVGLGIQVVFGRPRRSTDNAVVERCHGVLNNWVEPERRHNLDDLQSNLDDFVHIQRAVYPSCEGDKSRLQTYPELLQARQLYQRQMEEEVWQLQRVLDYVANFRFTRKVEKNGRITHFTHEYSLGRDYRTQEVTVYLDPQHCEWVVENWHGEILKRFAALQLNYLTISNMQMIYRKGKT